jgi:sugar phosphate isomerase/epimerase
MQTVPELMSLFWTTSGVFGDREISRFDFKDRVESAARAGFKGIGIWHTDLEHCTLHRSLKEMRMILDDNGICCFELEFLTDWFLDGNRKSDSDNRKRRLFEASAALNATHVKIGDFYNCVVPTQRLYEAFEALCTEAQNYGATIGFEFMTCSMIDNLKDTLTMLETVGAKNSGMIIDIVQIMHMGLTYAEISRIPLKYLLNFELNDGALPGSPLYDPTRVRRYCGEGDFDVKGLIKTARDMGFKGQWAVEVMSPELAVQPLDELNTRAFNTTMAEFVD